MMNRDLRTWIAGCAAVLLVVVGCGQAANSAGSKSDDAKHVAVSGSTFKSEVLEAEELVLVDFWAAWCAPCRMIAPSLDALVTEFDGKLKLAKVNVDHNQELAEQYKVQGIPYLVLFKDGKIVDAKVGAASKATYYDWVTKHL